MKEVKKSVAEFGEDFPGAKGQYRFIGGEQARKVIAVSFLHSN